MRKSDHVNLHHSPPYTGQVAYIPLFRSDVVSDRATSKRANSEFCAFAFFCYTFYNEGRVVPTAQRAERRLIGECLIVQEAGRTNRPTQLCSRRKAARKKPLRRSIGTRWVLDERSIGARLELDWSYPQINIQKRSIRLWHVSF